MMLDIQQLRKDTPGCELVLHFNNAGAALSPIPVVDAIKDHLDLEARIGGYEAAHSKAHLLDQFYVNAAQLIHCKKEEIAFMDNATRAWEMAFYSLKLTKGDKILTSVCEYASNYLAFLHKAKRTGVIIEVIANDASGQLDVNDLAKRIDNRVKLIAITHVPTNGGLINPAARIGQLANQHQIPYLLDATQSIGQIPMDVQQIGCDFLCATGRKYLRGPRGTGFLYANSRIIERCEPPFVDLHSAKWIADNDYLIASDAKRFETWEHYVAGKIGLGVAIDYLLQLGITACWERIQYLANRLRSQMATIPGITLHDLGENQCGIITFTKQSKQPQDIQHQLRAQKINVSISLQEYARLDMASRNLPALVRASVHYYNTEEEINRFVEQLAKL